MAEITFSNQSYLFLLLLVPFIIAIHFFTLRQTRGYVIKFSNFEAIERVSKGDVFASPYKGILKNKNIGLLLLRMIVYLLLILSVAGTTFHYTGKASSFDYAIAIDASSSMLADDFSPNRFEAAKQAAIKFVDAVPSDAEIGILTFSGTSIVELPLTQGLQKVKDVLKDLGIHESGGTAIGDAIITSANILKTKKSKAIVLLTDGRSNVGIEPFAAIDYAKQNSVVVHPIGVATKEGGKILNLGIVSKLDEVILKEMADKTNGRFFLVQNIESLENAFTEIAQSTKSPISLNLSWMLLVIAIVLLGLEWIFINTIYKTIP